MGRFEDLIAQAKAGDRKAIEALETEFSSSTLREKAEKSGTLESELAGAIPLARRGKFYESLAGLPEDLRSELKPEDVGEMPLGEITVDFLKGKAEAKQSARNEVLLDGAKAAGFDTVEEYTAALETVKQANAARKTGAESVGSGVASGAGGGQGGGSGDEDADFNEAKEVYDKARKSGKTEDIALGNFIEKRLTQQAPAPQQ
jgi:hypothetical protein